MSNAVSLTPGFSPVMFGETCQNRFNGFPRAGKPLKRLAGRWAAHTRLKPGVNEKHCLVAHFCRYWLAARIHRLKIRRQKNRAPLRTPCWLTVKSN
jgi:hypothetical protein